MPAASLLDAGETNRPPTLGPPDASASPIEELLAAAVSQGASDLVLTAGASPALRGEGELSVLTSRAPLSSVEIAAMVRPLLGERARERFTETRAATAACVVAGERFRLTAFHDHGGAGAFFRRIPEITPLDRQNLPEAVVDACACRRGLVLIAGPPSSGRTTLLTSFVDSINWTRTDRVVTIESPIESVHAQGRCVVSQREVGEHVPTFAAGVRAALHEDADVIVVGDLEEDEAVRLAVDASGSRLVFASLRARSAADAIDRVLDAFGSTHERARETLAGTLRVVVVQTLHKKASGGRVPVREILLECMELSGALREARTDEIPSILESGAGIGMISMEAALADLSRHGIV
jgi:twitching motility protein PilT